MGQAGPARTPSLKDGRALALTIGLATAALLLVITAPSSMGEGDGDADWGSLSVSSSTKAVTLAGDSASFRLHAHWGAQHWAASRTVGWHASGATARAPGDAP